MHLNTSGFLLQVFFTDLKYTYIESSSTYSPFSLMSDIGGSLGLFLGSSLLTLCELVDVAVVAALNLIDVRRERKQRVANTDNENTQSETYRKSRKSLAI